MSPTEQCPICVVCLSTVLNTELRQTDCGHSYHKTCLKDWLLIQTTCPSCQYQLREKTFVSSKTVAREEDDEWDCELDQSNDDTDVDSTSEYEFMD
jgi:hypothetical protein